MRYLSYPHSIFKITGADRIRYLQGRITQNIKSIEGSIAPGNISPWSLILSPQGKIEGVFYILLKEDSCLLVSDISETSSREEFLSALFRFKVADQVFAEDLSESYQVYTVFSESAIDESFIVKMKEHVEYGAVGYSAIVQRGSLYCLDLIVPRDYSSEFLQSEYGINQISSDDFEDVRIRAGFPLSGKDITSNIFAPDLPVSSYVSFNKGCYAGQEVVEMATARGRPNRTFVKIKGAGSVSQNGDLLLYIEKEGVLKKAGFVSSVSVHQDTSEFFALGYVKTVFLDEGDGTFFVGENEESTTSVTLSIIK